jgi:hypothetical protein
VQRLVTITLVFLAAIGLASGVAVSLFWEEAVELGEREEQYPKLLPRLARTHPERSLVVWLGDSTIEHAERRASALPRLVQRGLSSDTETRIVASPGLDPLQHYYLMGAILELQPSLIVMTANLTMFHRDDDELLQKFAAGLGVGQREKSHKLAYMVPASELTRALALPLGERGLGRSELLLLRVLAIPGVRAGLAFSEGLRDMFQSWLDGRLQSLLPAPSGLGSRAELLRRYQNLAPQFEAQMVEQYYRDIPASHPLLEILGASVSMATRHGVPVLVYVTPIPYARVPKLDWYDPQVFEERIGRIRSVVEADGGSFVDLHDVLPDASFFDLLGHYDRAGGERLAETLGPLVSAHLEPSTR